MTIYTIKTNAGNTVKLNLIGETGLISLIDLISTGDGTFTVDTANETASNEKGLWTIPFLKNGNYFRKIEIDYVVSGNDFTLKNLRIYDSGNNFLQEFNGFNMSVNKFVEEVRKILARYRLCRHRSLQVNIHS